MEQIVFATHNPHKIIEVQEFLKGNYELKGLHQIGWNDEIEENEPTLEGNARIKAITIFNKLKINVFADDTGLEVEALNGEPGVHSARYAGQSKNPQANIDLLLRNMARIENRKARFRTVICLYFNQQEYFFEGIVNGILLTEKRGISGFGYDPIFQPEGYNKTFAEMELSEKNKISHRALAMQQLIYFLKSV